MSAILLPLDADDQYGRGDRQRPRHLRVREQHPQAHRLGPELPRPDLVQRLLHDAVPRLAGEAGEVERHVRLLERPFHARAESDRALGALADEHAGAGRVLQRGC